jgi:CBS domain-containing protein
MKALDLAHRPAPSVPVGATVQEAAQAIRKFRCGALLVLDGHQLAGVLSERDLVLRVVARGLDPRTTPVAKVMTSPVARILAGADAHAAFELMASRQIRHLAVVDGRGRVVGLVTYRKVTEDCIRSSTEVLRALAPIVGILD